jgi:hypothetical protein
VARERCLEIFGRRESQLIRVALVADRSGQCWSCSAAHPSGGRATRSPDAIIVPATRPAQDIVAALRLGKQLGAHVIVMHSGTEDYHGLAVEARSVGLSEPAVVTLSEQFDAKLPCLGHCGTSAWALAVTCTARGTSH